MILKGKGQAFDITNQFEFLDCGDLMLTFGSETVTAPMGDHAGQHVIPVGMPITGRINWRQITAEMILGILGANADVGGLERVVGEALAVPAAPGPYVDTLANPPYNYTEVLYYADAAALCPCGQRLERMAAGSEDTGKYSIDYATGVITFDATDAEAVISVNYIFDGVDQIEVCLDPNALPEAFELICSLETWNPVNNAWNSHMIVHALHCVRTGDFAIGATIKATGTFGFDFAVVNSCNGDVCCYMPDSYCKYVAP